MRKDDTVMTITIRFDPDERQFVLCLVHAEEQFREKLFGMLSSNFSTESILEWKNLMAMEADFPQARWMLWTLEWLLYIYKGLKGKPCVSKQFSGVFGHHLVVEIKVPITASLVTWLRSTLRRKK